MFQRFILRNALWVVLTGLILSTIGGFYSVRLYRNLRADLTELLPSEARSVKDLGEVSARLQSVDNLALLITSSDVKASKRFVDDLARELGTAPRDLISSVEYRVDHELRFFQKRQALFLELSDLVRVKDQLQARIDYERELRNPLNIFSEEDIPEPKFEVEEILAKYSSKLGGFRQFPGGYYASPDETKRVILIGVTGDASSFTVAQKVRLEVESRVLKLNPASYSPDLHVWYSGNVQNVIEEQQALLADVLVSTVLVTFLVTAVLCLYFRTIVGALLLLTSLMMGTLITFGICYFAVGFLNANSAFLGSIVIGNGINFGIIYMARYLEERRKQHGHLRSTSVAIRTTAAATMTAALAAAVSYGSLMLTGFRGFKQFGLIGLIGMVACWLSAYTFLPAILTLARRLRIVKSQRHGLFGGVLSLVGRAPRIAVAFTVLATVASVAALTQLDHSVLEADLGKLRSKRSLEQGSGFHAVTIKDVLQRYLTPVVILAPTRRDAGRLSSELKRIRKQQGDQSLISSVQTLDDFIPKQQARKIELLQRIRKLLTPRVIRSLEPRYQELADRFLSEEAFSPITTRTLPKLLRDKFTEKDGSIGRMVLVEPPTDARIRERENLFSFVGTVRQVADRVAPGSPVAGTLPITSDLLSSIATDGPRATLFAFLSVSLLVALIFRHLSTIALSVSALLLGVLWLMGAVTAFGFKINFLNFVALPITFGIGVDYGVNVFQRYRLEKGRSIIQILKETGSAVALCSLTTMIGYGSLLIAQNQAFVSFGQLAILGEITCLVAAVVSLPAILLFAGRKRANPPQQRREFAEAAPEETKRRAA